MSWPVGPDGACLRSHDTCKHIRPCASSSSASTCARHSTNARTRSTLAPCAARARGAQPRRSTERRTEDGSSERLASLRRSWRRPWSRSGQGSNASGAKFSVGGTIMRPDDRDKVHLCASDVPSCRERAFMAWMPGVHLVHKRRPSHSVAERALCTGNQGDVHKRPAPSATEAVRCCSGACLRAELQVCGAPRARLQCNVSARTQHRVPAMHGQHKRLPHAQQAANDL